MRDQFGECSVGRRTVPARIVREREYKTSIKWVRLHLGFAQGRLAIAAQDRNHHLPAMAGGGRRLQFRRFARRSFGFIEFSFDIKNAGQVVPG